MPHTYIIAEAGVNHNGNLDNALKLVDIAVKAGADAVKFQTFKTENLVSVAAEKATYQQKTTDAEESQFTMLKRLELDQHSHEVLINYCKESGIQFLSSPFDLDSLQLLIELKIPTIKLGSGEITNSPLLLACAQTQKPMILSTGMATIAEIEQALAVLAFGYIYPSITPTSLEQCYQSYISAQGQAALHHKVSLLHCTTEYPAPFNEINLQVINSLAQIFGLPIGFSDHTEGITIPIAAVALGAKIIEKHITLDKNMSGPDHSASLSPEELVDMVKSIRQVEQALGQPQKIPTLSEQKNRHCARKSLVAKKNISKGELLTADNLTTKRPEAGVSPHSYWEIIGKIATKSYKTDDIIFLNKNLDN